MPDAVTGIIGAVLMIIFLVLIAAKLGETDLWIVMLISIGLMLFAVIGDTVLPLLRRRPKT